VIGLDFDNTIVCYDRVFARVAVDERLVPEGVAPTKAALRDALRSAGREPEWTELQGRVYGPLMQHAEPFPGALEFLEQALREGHELAIVSHRTRHPYLGERHDLHAAARAWLARHGVGDGGRVGLSSSRIHFELTKDDKLARIGALGCTVFVDDLPEILLAPTFPASVRRIHFDPAGASSTSPDLETARSWDDLTHALLDGRQRTS
jgi:hypothetical protein